MAIVLEQDQVGEFLAHFGVKGQKWGVRKRFFKKGRQGDWSSRTGKQKLGLVGGGAAGFYVGGQAGNTILRKFGVTPLTVIVGTGIQAATTVAGVRAARAFMDRHGSKKVRSR